MPQTTKETINSNLIDNPPSWLTKTGSSILLVIICVILLFSYLIKYPKIITTEVDIVTNTNPILISCETSGLLKFDKNIDGKWVEEGEAIGSIESLNNHHVIKSPIAGTVNFHKILNYPLQVSLGDELFYIIPKITDYSSYTYISKAALHKVKPGMKVLIKLYDYPYQEFGMVDATIKKVSAVPTNKGFLVKINLPKGLETTYDKKPTFIHNMSGTAEIIIEDIRLIERFFSFKS